jgi:pimeloyl-ACP methyl ester carboxylesterase
MTYLWILLALVVFVLAAAAHYAFWTRRLDVPMDYEVAEEIQTPDGASIMVYRLPLPSHLRTARPALLVHGIGIDHRNNDLLPNASLARHLHEAGRDVWLLRLRSGGMVRRFRDAKKVRFAAMAKEDIALGVETVLKRTSQTQLDYVGFSMGGMLLYAALTARYVDPAKLAKVVIIGSPARVGSIPFRGLITRLPDAFIPTIPIRFISRMFAFIAELFSSPIHHFIVNPGNLERGVTSRAMMTVEDAPSWLALDFLNFLREGGVVRIEGRDVVEGLRDIHVPVLFFVGGADRLAPAVVVRPAFEAWGASFADTDKRFVVLSVAAGALADYGHGDLAFGRHARVDLFDPIEAFLG